MISSGVTQLIQRRGRVVLTGRVRRRDFPSAPRSIALQLCGLTLAETVASQVAGGGPDVFAFRFVLSDPIAAILTAGAPLAVVANAIELPFAPRVQALRSTMADVPGLVREVAAKLREGFVLTTKGELLEPFAQRGDDLAQILDHYERCDRLTHEIIGHHLHVVGGTLLGAARNGGAIDHDVDFDVAYLSGARDAASLKVEHMALLDALLRRDEKVSLVNRRAKVRRRHFKWRSNAPTLPGAEPAVIDVFPAYIDAEGFYCRPTFVRIPGGEELILPLRRTAFAGREVWAPNRMIEKIASVFGPSWGLTDPFWSKPEFPGLEEALSDLTLSDDDLLALAAVMPARQAEQLRAALAANRAAEVEASRDV